MDLTEKFPMRLFIIRHGQTEWNRRNLLQGTTDVELSEEGEHQVRRLGEYLESEDIDLILSSPMKRAHNTAKEIARRKGLEIHLEPSLVERDLGELEGLHIDEAIKKYPHNFPRDSSGNVIRTGYTLDPDGGEGWKQTIERVTPLLERIQQHEGRTVLLSSHGDVNRAIIGKLMNLDITLIPTVPQDNTCINEFVLRDGKFELVRLNETKHLQDI